MEKVRDQFPVLRRYIYANTPVFGPWYDQLLEWRQEHDLDFMLKGSGMRAHTLGILSDTRSTVADYFNCKRDNVALVNNFSTGLNMFLEGLEKGQKVLLLENDYPSVEWPFDTRDFALTHVKINENLEENILTVLQKEPIDILALSIVQWQNGIKINEGFLREVKSEYPHILIIADGTQFCGTTDFDFESSGIDVLGASAYKWLLAGYGSGFMLFKDEVASRCRPRTIGFNAANALPEMKDTVRFARRFEPGHLSCMSFGSLNFSLKFLRSLGKEKIANQNKRLTEKAKTEFSNLGLLEEAVTRRKEHSTIFNIAGDEGLFEHLIENEVVCAQRGDGIRLGFHFYNTEKEIDDIVQIIKNKM